MPDLIAQGASEQDRWRRVLPSFSRGIAITLGRSGSDWNAPWDSLISRQHAKLTPRADHRIEVEKLASARNPIFFRGQAAQKFTLVPGEHFVIGDTTFTLAKRPSAVDSPVRDIAEHAYDSDALRQRHFRDGAKRIEMLNRLPDLISGSSSDEELLVRVAKVLLQATPAASAVAVVSLQDERAASTESEPRIEVLHFDSRQSDAEQPHVSARLIQKTVRQSASTLHLWSGSAEEAVAYTATDNFDWAFCVPLRSEACPGWAIYVTGSLGTSGIDATQTIQAAPDTLQDDVKFAELVGTMISNLRQSRMLERRQAAIRQFFAPVVMDAMAGRDEDEILEPREADLSVMFCDLRGFSSRSERDADKLLQLLSSVSDALGVMTRHILRTGGVIGDFHGDAAMGFWGWPLDQDDRAIRAVAAAVAIRDEYLETFETTGFRCGIGIASGRAVAGRIGTTDQVKVTAFGPVVNLASRLEGMTKAFASSIIVDQRTADTYAQSVGQIEDYARLRRLARVRPAGITKPVDISEIAIATGGPTQALTDSQITLYESALDALIDGQWDSARERLADLPEWDQPTQTLLSVMKQSDFRLPEDWDGRDRFAKDVALNNLMPAVIVT